MISGTSAIVLSVEKLESLEETLDIMGNTSLIADIRESLAELEVGTAVPESKDEALRLI